MPHSIYLTSHYILTRRLDA